VSHTYNDNTTANKKSEVRRILTFIVSNSASLLNSTKTHEKGRKKKKRGVHARKG
jgi:hypothetical protein